MEEDFFLEESGKLGSLMRFSLLRRRGKVN